MTDRSRLLRRGCTCVAPSELMSDAGASARMCDVVSGHCAIARLKGIRSRCLDTLAGAAGRVKALMRSSSHSKGSHWRRGNTGVFTRAIVEVCAPARRPRCDGTITPTSSSTMPAIDCAPKAAPAPASGRSTSGDIVPSDERSQVQPFRSLDETARPPVARPSGYHAQRACRGALVAMSVARRRGGATTRRHVHDGRAHGTTVATTARWWHAADDADTSTDRFPVVGTHRRADDGGVQHADLLDVEYPRCQRKWSMRGSTSQSNGLGQRICATGALPAATRSLAGEPRPKGPWSRTVSRSRVVNAGITSRRKSDQSRVSHSSRTTDAAGPPRSTPPPKPTLMACPGGKRQSAMPSMTSSGGPADKTARANR